MPNLVGNVSTQKCPNIRVFFRKFKRKLWIIVYDFGIVNRSLTGRPQRMSAECVLEHGRVPTQVDVIKKVAKRFDIDPKHTVVKVFSRSRVIVQRFFQRWRPIDDITFGIVALPSQMPPRIF